MSNLIESEAELSEDEEYLKNKEIYDDDDEDEDDVELDKDLEDLIDDNDEELSVESEGEKMHHRKKRKKKKKRKLIEDLEDEDYDLIEENLGVKVKRKKFRRLQLGSDESSGIDGDETHNIQKDRDVVAHQIFEENDLNEDYIDDDDNAETRSHKSSHKSKKGLKKSGKKDFESRSSKYARDEDDDEGEEIEDLRQDNEEEDFEDEEEYDDLDDFIVDDHGQPIKKSKQTHRKFRHNDASVQQAQDIFGCDFDFDEFEENYYDDQQELDEDDDDERRPLVSRQKKKAKNIFDLYEPSELEKMFLTDKDNLIRVTDIPERFQTRTYPVTPSDEGELAEEADWIFKFAFNTTSISTQTPICQDWNKYSLAPNITYGRKSATCVREIREVLNFMRNHSFEVPFIAQYRKEFIKELNSVDLWRIFYWDEKWCQVQKAKKNLVSLCKRLQKFQFNKINQNPDQPLPTNWRTLSDDDIDFAEHIESFEDYSNFYHNILFHYGRDIPEMNYAEAVAKREESKKNWKKKIFQNNDDDEDDEKATKSAEEEEDDDDESNVRKSSSLKKHNSENDPEDEFTQNEDNANNEEISGHDDKEILKSVKLPSKKGFLTLFEKAGLDSIANNFGLTTKQFGENLRDNYQRYEVQQDSTDIESLAKSFISPQFPSVDDVLRAVRYMVAMRISKDPLVRKCINATFVDRAKISVTPTKKGKKEIDEVHPIYAMKYLKSKPVRNLRNDEYLKLSIASKEGLITLVLGLEQADHKSYLEEIRPLFEKDAFSSIVQSWNKQRRLILERVLVNLLYPELAKELKFKLLRESRDCVLNACCHKLHTTLKIGPYVPENTNEDMDDYESSGLRVVGLAYSDKIDCVSYSVHLDKFGNVTDFLKLYSLLEKKSFGKSKKLKEKESELDKLGEFIIAKRPNLIAICVENKSAIFLQKDIKELCSSLETLHNLSPISVIIVDNELPTVIANSSSALVEFRDYPIILRKAVYTARKMQDPLIEYARIAAAATPGNTDESELTCLRFHPLQSTIPSEYLSNNLNHLLVNFINETGVDINDCLANPHRINLCQFICGLGPRKANALLKILRQNNNSRLENRTQLITLCHMGPKVFMNSAGFIKIDATSDNVDSYMEVLDSTRIHPETYDWARKMAADALDYDDTAEDANAACALEEILESPDRLKDLDLDAFAVELDRQGFGDKAITLYDIRSELTHRYKDYREPATAPSVEDRFNIISKETPQSFFPGKLVLAKVIGIAHKRPNREELDKANPSRDEESGNWECPFCSSKDFAELSEVWSHFDSGGCLGRAVGVRISLDNGIFGFIHVKNLSDNHVKNPSDRVKPGMTVHSRILKIDIERFSAELTSKTSDLVDKGNEFRPSKDQYYDFNTEMLDKNSEEEKIVKEKERKQYVKRVIAHPSFMNISYEKAEQLMSTLFQGDCIIRPSSKGENHLTVTWKVTNSITQHIDIIEEGKEKAFTLGKSLLIGKETFEDLDEIIARHIQPMAALLRDVINYKYYLADEETSDNRSYINTKLLEFKQKNPSHIPYFLSASKEYPGKVLLSYMPRSKSCHEYFTTLPEGFRYRKNIFHSLNALIRWFKQHFKDPLPVDPNSRPVSVSNYPAIAPPPSPIPHTKSINIDELAFEMKNNTSLVPQFYPPAPALFAMQRTPLLPPSHYFPQLPDKFLHHMPPPPSAPPQTFPLYPQFPIQRHNVAPRNHPIQ